MFNNRRLAFWAFILIVSAALTGCATTKSISDVGFPLAGSVVYITAVQNELQTETSSTNPAAGGGGLLGVLIAHSIDSTRNRRAEEAVTELRNALIDFPIADEFSQAVIESGLPGRLSLIEPRLLREAPGADFQHERDFVELHPKVQLSNNLAALEVSIWIREFELNNKNRPRFTGFAQGYKYVHPLPEPAAGKNRTDYAEAWLTLGADAIEGLIRLGMDATIEAALTHLNDRGFVHGTPNRYRIPDYTNRLAYQVRRETGDLLWLNARATPDETIIASRAAVELVD